MADVSIDSNLSGTVGSNISGSLGSVGPVTVAGIPNEYTFHIKDLPKLEIAPLDSTVRFEPVTLKIDPIETSISIKEVPSLRTHLPANYTLALSLFGVEIAAIQLCGEGQIITEPYRPNPCEVCGRVAATPVTPDVSPGQPK
jgi:hypothetical protein